MRGVFLSHPSSLEHDTGGHPEQAARIAAIETGLEQRDWLGFERVSSPEVELEVLYAIHPPEYVQALERISAAGGGSLDPDTVTSAGSYTAALHSAGGAVRMVEQLLDGEADVGFSAHRPPGHHALPQRPMGFCLFNNVAVAASFALEQRGLERVMVLDWDVHHGNGTNDIFHSSRQVLFVSIHQSPLYPGTGPAGDVGSGPGEGYTVNLPVPPGSGDELFGSLLDDVAVPLGKAFAPQLVLVSAGYDAHRDDHLAECMVTEAGFARMARSVLALSTAVGAPLGLVLEGGYALRPLARSVAATLEALVAPPPAADAEGPRAPNAPVVLAARTRLGRWWPSLA